jgi:myosin-5
MLTASEVQDEVIDSLILNLRIPLPSSQTVASEQDVLFPSHLLGYLILKELDSNISNHMLSTMTAVAKGILFH